MRKDQVLMGVLIAVVSLVGIASDRWLLARTRKGQALVKWFGEETALWVLRGILAAFAILGALLASDVVRPIQW